MALILEEMSEGSKLHIGPTFQKITLREGGRGRGERGGGGVWVQRKNGMSPLKVDSTFQEKHS